MARQKLRKPHAPDPSGEPELVQVLLPRAVDERRVARRDRLPRLAGLEGREADGTGSTGEILADAQGVVASGTHEHAEKLERRGRIRQPERAARLDQGDAAAY